MKTLVVIPARYGSTRLPAKVLLNKTGKFLMHHTYDQVRKCKLVDRIIIATDDKRVVKAGLSFCAETMMTSKNHACGTDRIAEVARSLPYQLIINVQADEPEIDPKAIDRVIMALRKDPKIDIATVAVPLKPRDLADPNKVKAFFSRDRLATAFVRSIDQLKYFSENKVDTAQRFRHIGIYGYRKQSLLRFVKLPQSELEKEIRLEQLRAMANGFRIKMVLLKSISIGYGIDTPEDYDDFVKRNLRKKY